MSDVKYVVIIAMIRTGNRRPGGEVVQHFYRFYSIVAKQQWKLTHSAALFCAQQSNSGVSTEMRSGWDGWLTKLPRFLNSEGHFDFFKK